MKKLILITVGVLLLLVPVACATPQMEPRPVPMPPVRATDEAGFHPMRVQLTSGEIFTHDVKGPEGQAGPAGPGGVLPPTAIDRMIICSGEMSLVVDDVVAARDEITQLAVKLDGHVVSAWISGEEHSMRGLITIRVPHDKFEQALAEFRDLAVRVTSESTSSRDVTEEYIDLESRLRNAEATEKQFLVLLEKAETVEDILRVYDRLSRVRSEIEQIKGRMQYLERTVAMSLISVHLQPAVIARPLVRVGWSAVEALESAIRGIVIFGQYLGTIAIWLIIFIPVWGIALGIICYWRRRRRKIQDHQGDSPP
ncbi:DUF4349 domain-containing protein, partial [Dehalococcoidia bacterium]|nr:DUF4349 domain-containing protein [Dehalococcoidia bacterium]